MRSAVQFEGVSKKYNLNAGQTSLRDAISTSISKIIHRNHQPSSQNEGFWALRDVSFKVDPGHALGLIGPNGAGKTTALKILGGITEPTSGTIKVDGRTSALIELGAGFHPDLTGRENIFLNAAILGLSRQEIKRLFDQIVAFSGLEAFIDTPVKRYSSGMYVRLGFSVAAHVEPDVLLVDEVLAVGDAQFRQRCARRIEELQNSGVTILFVAHNLYLVKSICDEAIFLHSGRIQAQGDVVSVINAYETWLHEREVQSMIENQFTTKKLFGTSSVEIEAVDVKSLDGTHKERFLFNENVELGIYYQARETIRQPKLVIRIMRADGTTCCMIRTAEYGQQMDDLIGRGKISVALTPLQLAGGAYVAEVRLMGPVDGVPIAQSHSKWFLVEGRSFGHEEVSGVFVPEVAWSRVEPGVSLDGNNQPTPIANGNRMEA
jgi:lipopolysaccharide transport system ATP-binding protein